MEEDGLGLIVGSVGDGNSEGALLLGDAGEEVVSGFTGFFFQGAAMTTGTGLDIFLGRGEGEAQGFGLGPYEVCVGIGGGASEAMVEVGDVEVKT